jgi:diadenosine tetraphosphatase ApaH/serine/threonine PP2A family protein phosphatase
MKAIISDIHGNLEALRVVLADIERLEIKDVVCLGDVIGYGPDPGECLDLVRDICSLALMGNHEDAVINGVPPNFTLKARRAVEWTRQVLFEARSMPEEIALARRMFLESLKKIARLEGVTYAHASPRDPVREYILPRDAGDKEKMDGVFAAVEDYCFCGHSHTPGVFTPSGFTHPSDMFDVYMLGTDEKALINVGSVGQPRDGDPRACYVTFDGDTIVWRRVEYDFGITAAKIYEIPALDKFLADRLREGR